MYEILALLNNSLFLQFIFLSAHNEINWNKLSMALTMKNSTPEEQIFE
jgi:hypothetical protein